MNRDFVLGDQEREVFVAMMWKHELLCGVKVLAYCVMSNHFHLLLEMPPENAEMESTDAFLDMS